MTSQERLEIQWDDSSLESIDTLSVLSALPALCQALGWAGGPRGSCRVPVLMVGWAGEEQPAHSLLSARNLPSGNTGIREGFLEKVTATLRHEG